MAVTVGVQPVTSNEANVIQSVVLLNSDAALQNPLTTLVKPENFDKIYTALGISQNTHNIGQISLSSITVPLFNQFTYNFSIRFIAVDTPNTNLQFAGPPGVPGKDGKRGEPGPPGGPAGPPGPAGPALITNFVAAVLTQDENDYNPTGLAGALTVAGRTILKLDPGAQARIVTGILSTLVQPGKELLVVNTGSLNLTFPDANVNSSVGSRFISPSGDVAVLPRGNMLLMYDTDWRVI